jgi:hypothetical protein
MPRLRLQLQARLDPESMPKTVFCDSMTGRDPSVGWMAFDKLGPCDRRIL